jgi:hypothetical protein
MAKTPEHIKLSIVQRLACFNSLDNIVSGLKEDFGFEMSKQAILGYDPTKVQGSQLSKKLSDIFYETRKKFTEDTSSIPIAHKAVRLATLQRMVDKAETKGNMVMVRDILEQAAKEVGDAYSNKKSVEVTNPDGSLAAKPTIVELVAPSVESKD